jgi:hypothetical protein
VATPAEQRRFTRLRRAHMRSIKRLERCGVRGRRWFDVDKGARLAHDSVLLAKHGFTELKHEIRDGVAVIVGTIPLVTGPSGVTHRIALEIRFPPTYPREEPAVYDIAHRFKAHEGRLLADRHLAEDGSCCLWLRSRSEWDARNPDALAHFLRQVVAFFERQLIYDVLRRWPGPEYSHGDEGYAQDVRETLQEEPGMIALYEAILRGEPKPRRRSPCPCGDGRPYVSCHKIIFDNMRRRLPPRFLNAVHNGAIRLIQ